MFSATRSSQHASGENEGDGSAKPTGQACESRVDSSEPSRDHRRRCDSKYVRVGLPADISDTTFASPTATIQPTGETVLPSNATAGMHLEPVSTQAGLVVAVQGSAFAPIPVPVNPNWDQEYWRVCVVCRETTTRWRDDAGQAVCQLCGP
jgi:hypothetical protein